MKSRYYRQFFLYVLYVCAVVFDVMPIGSGGASEASLLKCGGGAVGGGVKTSVQYDDNVFLEPKHEKHDYIFRITPTISLSLPFGFKDKHSLFLDYTPSKEMFHTYTSQDHVNHRLKGVLNIDFNICAIALSDEYLYHYSRGDVEFDERILHEENTFKCLVSKAFNRFSYDIEYRNYLVDYYDDFYTEFNRNENEGRVTGYMQVFPKTKILLEGRYEKITYDEVRERDADAYSALTGFIWKVTGKTTGTVKCGYQSKKYDDEEKDDFNSGIVEADMRIDLRPRTLLIFGFQRAGLESTVGESFYYTSNQYSAEIRQYFFEKWTGKLKGSYAHNRYSDDRRIDNVWRYSAGLDYQIVEWALVSIEYEHKERNSNTDNNDYERNLVTVSTSVVF